MKKHLVPMIIGVVLMLSPALVMAASITGSVQGFQCVTAGKICPIGMEDPLAAIENVFVVLVDAAKADYYFVPNVDRAVMVRHINEQIRVNGTVNEKSKTIRAQEIYVGPKKVWSANMEDDIYRDIFGTPRLGGQGGGGN